MADRQDVPLAGLGATGCTLVVGAYCSSVRRKHSRGGNEATLPQEFSKPLPLAGFFLSALSKQQAQPHQRCSLSGATTGTVAARFDRAGGTDGFRASHHLFGGQAQRIRVGARLF